ncbi:MAG: hypothetical protein MUF54_04360 [Polyangiaceae bacterium]|nr:hypothetical protein [Polyangiaceae bacterium]
MPRLGEHLDGPYGAFVNNTPLTSLRGFTPMDVVRAGNTRFRVRIQVVTEGGLVR